ncbi:probable inactive poly [ADP-ribose] polymerase SRO5 isoform X1 [Eucalyptus grandis]|uniref:probable inactive poly [ADP-ribose] polymerase SRO5 isoform X1 n=1 Tax=Eucalyptus grandis TaxID=71139 RepID=UPI00192F08DC|nr:probable inactive poly [ADP-ribose] polymerase SRO5 isoform X1 [Eucalyptus grandis]
MSDYIDQSSSLTVPTVTSDVVAEEFNHLAIDVERPDLNKNDADDQVLDSSISNCLSIVSADQSGSASLLFDGSKLMELSEGDTVYRFIKQTFVSKLGDLGAQVTVVAIHQNDYSSSSAKARAVAFQLYSEAVQKKGGSNTANVSYAWCATSKEEVPKIFSCGFNFSEKHENNGFFGCGVYFAPLNHPLESIVTAPVDNDGLRHMLLCRVILGKSELVSHGSEQSLPSSEQYDSGIDDLSSPRRYIIWSTHMNTHVLPEIVVSFRAPCFSRGSLRTPKKWNPNSPYIPFRFFMKEFSKTFPPSDIDLVSKYYKAYKERRMSKQLLVRIVRKITGDRWLIGIINSFRAKYYRA